MATSDRFNILIIDPDTASRSRLKQVALSLTTFHHVYVCNNITEAIQKGKLGEQIDVAVISYSFSLNETDAFIKEIKQTANGGEWALVSVLKSAEQQGNVLAEHVAIGIDGFLFEPYSADNLREMAEITAKIKRRNSDKRKFIAIKMLLTEAAKHIDAVSFYRSKGKDVPSATKKLKEASIKLEKYKKESPEIYVNAIIEVFGEVAPPLNTTYNGVSMRVRQKLETKRLAELEEEYELTK